MIYPEDLSRYNEELLSTINDNFSSFDALSPDLRSTNESTNYAINYRSDTESSAFTNISVGDISPFENSDIDNLDNENIVDLNNGNDTESFKSMSDDELFSSTQGTILGVGSSCNTSVNQQPNLINLQNNNGNRQVRYYTSMSVLNRFKKYFK